MIKHNRTYQSIAILSIKGVGNVIAKTILELLDPNIKPTSKVWASVLINLSPKISRFNPNNNLVEQGLIRCNIIIEESEKSSIFILSIFDKEYPACLKNIKDSPLILYYKGDVSILDTPTVAIIGTRSPSEHSIKASNRLGVIFSDKHFTIVSGLAEGCDTAAHEGCIGNDGRTIAVLANGLDSIYPKKNEKLAEHIISSNGLILSEYPIGTPPSEGAFIKRNRIQAGLSHGVIVIECSLDSGTMHTIKYAQKYDRPVGCYWNDAEYDKTGVPDGNNFLVDNLDVFRLDNRANLSLFEETLLDFTQVIPSVKSVTQKKLF